MANGSAPQGPNHTFSHFLQEEWLPAVKPHAPLHLGQLLHLHHRLRPPDPRASQAAGAHPAPASTTLHPHLLERGHRNTCNRGCSSWRSRPSATCTSCSAQRPARRYALGLLGPQRRRGGRPTGRPNSPEQKVWSPQELGGVSTMSVTTVCTPCGCWSPPLACAAASSLARWVDIDFDHATVSPTIPGGRRPPGPRLGTQDRAGPDAASPWIRSQHRSTANSRPRTARRSEALPRPGLRLHLARTAARCTPRTSPTGSNSTPGPPGCPGYAYMTCAIATPPRPSRPGSRPR